MPWSLFGYRSHLLNTIELPHDHAGAVVVVVNVVAVVDNEAIGAKVPNNDRMFAINFFYTPNIKIIKRCFIVYLLSSKGMYHEVEHSSLKGMWHMEPLDLS